MKIIFFFFFMLLGLVELCNAQQNAKQKIDSLQILLEKSQLDSSKVNCLINLSREFITFGNLDSSLHYGNVALKLATELDYKRGIANANDRIGIAYDNQGNHTKALEYFQKELLICQEINYKKGIADSYNSIGNFYSDLGDYNLCLKSFLMALQIREEIHDSLGIASTNSNIGTTYSKLGNYPKALEYWFNAIKYFEEKGDKKRLANLFSNIAILYGNQDEYSKAAEYNLKAFNLRKEIGDKRGMATTYMQMGGIYRREEKYPEALENYTASLKLMEEIGDKNGLARLYNNTGNLYNDLKDYEKALNYYFNGLKICELTENRQAMAESNNNIANVYFKQKKYKDSRIFVQKAINISHEIGSKIVLMNAYSNLYKIDSVEGNIDQSFENYKLYIAFRDSLSNKESAFKISKLQMQFEFDKRDDSIRIEQKRIDEISKSKVEILNRENEVQKLKVKNQESQIQEAKLFSLKKENEIKILNQSTEIQNLELNRQKNELQQRDLIANTKNKELLLLSKENELKQKEISRQKIFRNYFIGGFSVVLLFAGIFFIQRNKIKTEKMRSDELLLNILPSEVAEELKQKGNTEAKQFDEVTVMFTDFKGFTQISEKLTPAELVAEIDTCFKAFDSIIGKHNIEKIKTIGDSYMCAGGLPVVNRTNAVDMINAALEIQHYMKGHIEKRNLNGKEIFEIRIGLNTGPVVAGIVGLKKFAYDIWGDTVNIASRMESSGEAGKVNISGSTYELVKNKFNCVYRGKIHAKNKGEIDMYFVESVS